MRIFFLFLLCFIMGASEPTANELREKCGPQLQMTWAVEGVSRYTKAHPGVKVSSIRIGERAQRTSNGHPVFGWAVTFATRTGDEVSAGEVILHRNSDGTSVWF